LYPLLIQITIPPTTVDAICIACHGALERPYGYGSPNNCKGESKPYLFRIMFG